MLSSICCGPLWTLIDLSSVAVTAKTGLGEKTKITAGRYCDSVTKCGCFQIN